MRKVDNNKLFWEILDYQFLTDDEIGGNAQREAEAVDEAKLNCAYNGNNKISIFAY